jgi:hypothetical protein
VRSMAVEIFGDVVVIAVVGVQVGDAAYVADLPWQTTSSLNDNFSFAKIR